MVRGIPVDESCPTPSRNDNVLSPMKPIRAELASTIKNLLDEKLGYLPLLFCGQRQVMARFMYFYPGNLNRNRIADTDNITKLVKDAIEMVGLVTNDRQINDEHAARINSGQRVAGDEAIHQRNRWYSN